MPPRFTDLFDDDAASRRRPRNGHRYPRAKEPFPSLMFERGDDHPDWAQVQDFLGGGYEWDQSGRQIGKHYAMPLVDGKYQIDLPSTTNLRHYPDSDRSLAHDLTELFGIIQSPLVFAGRDFTQAGTLKIGTMYLYPYEVQHHPGHNGDKKPPALYKSGISRERESIAATSKTEKLKRSAIARIRGQVGKCRKQLPPWALFFVAGHCYSRLEQIFHSVVNGQSMEEVRCVCDRKRHCDLCNMSLPDLLAAAEFVSQLMRTQLYGDLENCVIGEPIPADPKYFMHVELTKAWISKLLRRSDDGRWTIDHLDPVSDMPRKLEILGKILMLKGYVDEGTEYRGPDESQTSYWLYLGALGEYFAVVKSTGKRRPEDFQIPDSDLLEPIAGTKRKSAQDQGPNKRLATSEPEPHSGTATIGPITESEARIRELHFLQYLALLSNRDSIEFGIRQHSNRSRLTARDERQNLKTLVIRTLNDNELTFYDELALEIVRFVSSMVDFPAELRHESVSWRHVVQHYTNRALELFAKLEKEISSVRLPSNAADQEKSIAKLKASIHNCVTGLPHAINITRRDLTYLDDLLK